MQEGGRRQRCCRPRPMLRVLCMLGHRGTAGGGGSEGLGRGHPTQLQLWGLGWHAGLGRQAVLRGLGSGGSGRGVAGVRGGGCGLLDQGHCRVQGRVAGVLGSAW